MSSSSTTTIRHTTRIVAGLIAGLALVGGASAVAMAAPAAPAPASTNAPAAPADSAEVPRFANGVHATMVNETGTTLTYGTHQIKPGERATISNGSAMGRDIVAVYSYGEGKSYPVEAKNPSIGVPWIRVATSGERVMGEHTSFTTEFDGHRVEVQRNGDHDSGWKQFTIIVKA